MRYQVLPCSKAIRIIAILGWIVLLPSGVVGDECGTREITPGPMVGAYYFGGWAGRNRSADDPNQAWAKNAPSHLTKRLIEEFSDREPLWGWRDDSLEIMERQIDLAADHGLAFFTFCWYWHDSGLPINKHRIREDSKNTCLDFYLRAKNNSRLRFCLLVANHQGYEIKGTQNWKEAGDFWMPYLKHPQYVRIGGKPLVIVFDADGGDKEGFAAMQEAVRKAGLPGLAIAGCGGGTAESGYTHRTHYNVVPNYTMGSRMQQYVELVAANRLAWDGSRDLPYIPIMTAGWDRRPWEGPAGLNQPLGYFYPDRTPQQFADFLRDAIVWMDKHPEQTITEHMVLIYAWNEFGEGGYITPTQGDSDGKYLKALRSVLMPATQPSLTGR